MLSCYKILKYMDMVAIFWATSDTKVPQCREREREKRGSKCQKHGKERCTAEITTLEETVTATNEIIGSNKTKIIPDKPILIYLCESKNKVLNLYPHLW